MLQDENPHYNQLYLEHEVEALARSHRITTDKEPLQPIEPMLRSARRVLTDAYRELALAAKRNRELSRAAEWLIDNFYIIQEQLVQLNEDLPPSYYKKLPRLRGGEYAGMPRIYEVVQVLATISDNIIDRDNTTVAIQAYQQHQTLTIGELWGVPIMLRLVLLVRLRQRIENLLDLRKTRNRADERIEEFLQGDDRDEPGALLRYLTTVERPDAAGKVFYCVLAQRLQARGLLTDAERRWFDYQFSRWDSRLEEELRYEAQRTSRLHLSIQNAIASLREVSESDWADFVEDCSLVERILQLDPAGYYPNMDFESRDRYRKVIEKVSAHSAHSETEVAQQVLLLAEEQAMPVHEGRTTETSKSLHVGYYLIDQGFGELARAVNYHMPWGERLRRISSRHPSVYFAGIGMHLAILFGLIFLLTNALAAPPGIVLAALAAAFFPALELSVVSTNRIISLLVPPRILPKLMITGDIRDDLRTLVVVPTLITSPADARRQLEALEIRALANPNRSLQFALLSDFTDAGEADLPSDKELIRAALEEVHRLNKRYSSRYGDKFYLLHRRRVWNEKEHCWMGWERKRGKIEELNRLLREPDRDTTYRHISGDFLASITKPAVRYVITLDADTKMPPGSALEMISTAGHPLNQAVIDEERGVVTEGYGIFQPRISITPRAAEQSLFSKIFSGNVGIDPYTTAVSDVYQDMFGEGVFTGKGLYDVAVFDELLGGRFPENTVLSHDLLESTYLRTALLTDIELFDDYPTNYLNYSKRNHRWIRGDWQILYWLLRRVPGPDGQRVENPINILSRWKIFDNLRRSLNPVFLLVFLLSGWLILPGAAVLWTIAAVGILAFPIYSSFTMEIFRRPNRVKWKLYLEKIRMDLKVNTEQALTTFIFLPHQAWVAVDAIARTLWRMFGSREHLLEWESASQAEKHSVRSLSRYGARMWASLAWGAICLLPMGFYSASLRPLVIGLVAVWAAAPVTAWWLKRALISETTELNDRQQHVLRGYARRTWFYFDRYVNAEHSWLPPDNYQQEPYIGVAARTSPTNIGLALVATCTAYRFGYIGVREQLYRLQKMLESVKALQKHKGHLFNWYSTRQGDVLSPRYVSTVDSGNLAASLLVVKQALLQLSSAEWPNPAWWRGLGETIAVLGELTDELAQGAQEPMEEEGERIRSLLADFHHMLPAAGTPPASPAACRQVVNRLQPVAEQLAKVGIRPMASTLTDEEIETLEYWFKTPARQLQNISTEIEAVLSKQEPQPAAGTPQTGTPQPLPRGWADKARKLAALCQRMVDQMDFSILYNRERDLFSIGYNLDHASMDKATYDQLATEARLASYLAIAKGDVPPRHWFRLSRRLTSINRSEILLSWGGTMFEYLMPVLFMAHPRDTLLSNTFRDVVEWQEHYGALRDRPWGFSESAYAVLNMKLHYQYRAFGAPGLGLRRGLAEDYVVSPYATMLALMIRPHRSFQNLQRLAGEGAYGPMGFYEAVDYSPRRSSATEGRTVIEMYMAHHQGMSLGALANVLEDRYVQRLFQGDPMVRSCEVLLQERIPRGIPIKEPRPIDVELEPGEEQKEKVVVEHLGREVLEDSVPRVHLLSNGHYTTVLTHAGTGYSFCDDITLTRWRGDRVSDAHGFFFYIRDLESDIFWSAGHQPSGRPADRYDSWLHTGKVQAARVDEWVETFVEVCVSPEDNIELRKLTLTNYSQEMRRLELTSYIEVVLNTREAERAHPVFSNLFVQTDYIPEHHALIAKRRPRSEEEDPIWMVHTMASEDPEEGGEPLQYETERGNFIGRGRSARNPKAMDPGIRLSGSVGNVPDPVLSMRRIIELEPGQKKSVTFGLGKVNSLDQAITMADQYDNPYATDRVFELASIYSRVELEHVGLSSEQAYYFMKLAGALLYGSEQLRPPAEVLVQNRKTQSGLWPYGISGDLPILLYQISSMEDLRSLDQLLKGYALWRQKGLAIDLVILNNHPTSYINELQDAVEEHIEASAERQQMNRRGGIFILRSDSIAKEDLVLLKTVAAGVIEGRLHKLDFSVEPKEELGQGRTLYEPVTPSRRTTQQPDSASLSFFNEYGGFDADGKSYTIYVRGNTGRGEALQYPPAPWINVLSNEQFGCITSESGADYTWSRNSRENRLTPWSNDPVEDPPGDCIYLRDHSLKKFWSPTPLPAPARGGYKVKHGFGFSWFQTETAGLHQELTKWVACRDPLKVMRLRLTNTGLAEKKLDVVRYLEWVLGVHRRDAAHHIQTDFKPGMQAITARNHYNNEFAGRVAFTGFYTEMELMAFSATADRESFLGRNSGPSRPRAVQRDEELNARFGAGFDPCAAFMARFILRSGQTADFYFVLGEEEDEQAARALMERYRDRAALEASLEEVRQYWEETLGQVQVQTPVPAINYLMNGWLQYQNIACRIWARTGFYQSGGAYGFRDQLQDVSSALYLAPELARSQILYHAAHQFPEGDVLHWWHPPTDRGTRTRISDDLLWLPYVAALYICRTGDSDILSEPVPFVSARRLEEGEQEAYLEPERSSLRTTLYEHCCRAIDRSLATGRHGLPLMGAGDWNDSMNNIGKGGEGESVWLGFFLYKVLGDFIPHCEQQKDEQRLHQYQKHRKELGRSLNASGWDGAWYRRAFYDDGTPVGSAQSRECRIDAIAQSWSVISGAAPPERAQQALASAEEHLVDARIKIIRLLAPPFDTTERDPGYIKGYLPGVRENGGQYTHAALWLVRAFAEAGRHERALELMQMLLPTTHSSSRADADRYRVEPYAVAADIYSEPPLAGMGGWSWYTGSAGWMYRVLLESILGLQLHGGDRVTIQPVLPASWDRYSVTLKHAGSGTTYCITVCADSTLSVSQSVVREDEDERSGEPGGQEFRMKRDGDFHQIEIRLPA